MKNENEIIEHLKPQDFRCVIQYLKNIHFKHIYHIPKVDKIEITKEKDLRVIFISNAKVEPITIKKEFLVTTSLYEVLIS